MSDTDPKSGADDIIAALDRINKTLKNLVEAICSGSLTPLEKRKLRGTGPALANPVRLSKINIHTDQIKPLLVERDAVSTDDVLNFLEMPITLSAQNRAGRALIYMGWEKKRIRSGKGFVAVYVKPAGWEDKPGFI